MKVKLSIIIPTLNEQEYLPRLLSQLTSWSIPHEIIVVDGGSEDGTLQLNLPSEAKLLTCAKGRSKQLNYGAESAKGKYLLFLHADSSLDSNFVEVTEQAIDGQVALANYKLRFSDAHWWLGLQAFFSRFTSLYFQFGDQGLLLQRSLFDQVSGYREEMQLLEDQEILERLIKREKLKKLNTSITTSARKYQRIGTFKLQFIYYRIYWEYKRGKGQGYLKALYQRLVSKTN